MHTLMMPQPSTNTAAHALPKPHWLPAHCEMTIKRSKSQSLQAPPTRFQFQPLKGSLGGGLGRANWEFVRQGGGLAVTEDSP